MQLILQCCVNTMLVVLQLSPTKTIMSKRSTAKVREETQTLKGRSTPTAGTAWREVTLAGGHARTWHHSYHSHGLLPEVDALSRADSAGPTFRLGSPELLSAAAARTEEMLPSKFLM